MAYTTGTMVRVKIGDAAEVGTITNVEKVETGKRGRPAINYTVEIGGKAQVLKSSALRPVKAEAAKAEVVTAPAVTEEF